MAVEFLVRGQVFVDDLAARGCKTARLSVLFHFLVRDIEEILGVKIEIVLKSDFVYLIVLYLFPVERKALEGVVRSIVYYLRPCRQLEEFAV